MSNSSSVRVARDLREILSTPNLDNPPMYATTEGERLDHVTALIMGPNDTPYHFGFFYLDLRFPETYPNEPPRVKFTTTDSCRVRFNPNLYADGKVCLSILGTWRGETAEVWRSSYSVGYVLSAIQSIIMNNEPYHNEPGFEKETVLLEPGKEEEEPSPTQQGQGQRRRKMTAEQLKKETSEYSAKITHETLRVAVCDILETITSGRTVAFAAEVKREFLCRYETYVEVCEREKHRDGQAFQKAPFEYPGNACEGTFNYASIIKRLGVIREQLEAETNSWRELGRELTARRAYLASTLRDEVARLEGMGISGGPVSDDNMFVWNLHYMQPEGLYEEGMFTLELVIPEDRNEYPRVMLLPENAVLHPTVSPKGIPWFHVPLDKKDNLHHIYKCVMDLLTHAPSPSPATWINTEVANMCFSRDPEKQKHYRRKARDHARQTVS
eukprot:PhM_4_TR10724/c0_g1_i1/m.13060/K10585/UBE2Z; ubiquitin-conjugating enzyme E2 Z